jgi:uncharacterized membrane protein YqhA
MKTILESTRYLTLVAVIALLLTAAGAFGWASIKTIQVLSLIISSRGSDPKISYYLLQVLDGFLVALTIYVLSISIYELFIDKLNMPPGMLAHSYHELKIRLSGLIILVASVFFIEELIKGLQGQNLFYLSASIALITASLVAYSYLSGHD